MVTYCNYKGCTNKATVLSYSKELKDLKDNDAIWHVFVNVCDEHFHDMIPAKPEKIGWYIFIVYAILVPSYIIGAS